MCETPHVLEVALEPKNSAMSGHLEMALREFAAGKPDIEVAMDQERGLSLLRAGDERILDETVGTLKEFLPFEIIVGALQVVYRETLSRTATIRYTHKKSTNPSPQFADVTIAFEPLPSGSGVAFENDSTQVPAEFVPAIEKGLRMQAQSGLLAGFPVTDFVARLVDAKYHQVDSSPLAFDIAARAAFCELAAKGVAVLLEPVMKVEVTTPDAFLGSVIGDLNSRRGKIRDVQPCEHGSEVIAATVPLSCMLGYPVTLDAMTQGHGHYKMAFDSYEWVPIDGGDDNFPVAAAMRA